MGDLAPTLPVTFDDVLAAKAVVQDVVNETPALTSRTFDERVEAEVVFKCENFQRTGSFKLRGAYSALSKLSDEQKNAGVIAYSSGNHAQAVALAGRLLGVAATIIMPNDAPAVKLRATRGYGAEVVPYDRERTRREELAAKIAAERALTIIPPYDHPDIIAGQGTAALELVEQVGDLDVLVVPCGGGGLLSGSALAARGSTPACRVIGVEPAAGDDATRSFHSGKLHTVDEPDTIADGARTPSLGEYTFPLVRQLVDDMVTVTDRQLIEAMHFMWERMKVVVEPTGALGAAAVLQGRVDTAGMRVGVIISGGNVDLQRAAALFRKLG